MTETDKKMDDCQQKLAAMTSSGGADQQVKTFEVLEQWLPVSATLCKNLVSHMPNTRNIWQWQTLLNNDFHLRQEDPLHPQLKVEPVDAEWLLAGQVVLRRNLVAPQPLRAHFLLDQQQELGDFRST